MQSETAGHGGSWRRGHGTERMVLADDNELERGGETLPLVDLVADELDESGVAGGQDDGKTGRNIAAGAGAA